MQTIILTCVVLPKNWLNCGLTEIFKFNQSDIDYCIKYSLQGSNFRKIKFRINFKVKLQLV